MGKKSKLKEIRRIANQLPQLVGKSVKGEFVTGKELIERGVKLVERQTVIEDKIYKEKKIVATPLNHNRKMKKLYNKYGGGGVNAYIKEVVRIDKQLKEKKAQKDATGEEKETVTK